MTRSRRKSHADKRQSSLFEAKIKKKKVLKSLEKAYGQFDLKLCDSLSCLSILYSMEGKYDKAIPILHRKLVIYEKNQTEEFIGDALHDLGIAYKNQENYEMAEQHLQRALTLREKVYGGSHTKIAETLSSLSGLFVCKCLHKEADQFHKKAVEIFYEFNQPEDENSEEIPWEVYKRLRNKRGPSTARNSLTLLKGSIRAGIQAALKSSENLPSSPANLKESTEEAKDNHSESTRFSSISEGCSPKGLHQQNNSTATIDNYTERSSLSSFDDMPHQRLAIVEQDLDDFHESAAIPQDYENDLTLESLILRVDELKKRIAAGFPGVKEDIDRLTYDVESAGAGNLRNVGILIVSLARELHDRLYDETTVNKLPKLEGYVEKNSSSMFKSWDRRWFSVDPSSFIMSYYHSKQDQLRGLSARGSFSISKIVKVSRQETNRGKFIFELLVDTSTRNKAQSTRVYELKTDTEEELQYWIDTLQKYKRFYEAANKKLSRCSGDEGKSRCSSIRGLNLEMTKSIKSVMNK